MKSEEGHSLSPSLPFPRPFRFLFCQLKLLLRILRPSEVLAFVGLDFRSFKHLLLFEDSSQIVQLIVPSLIRFPYCTA
jgi:hypothetical protein